MLLQGPRSSIQWHCHKALESGGPNGAGEEREQPSSQSLIDILLNAHQQLANTGQIKACATLYDVKVVLRKKRKNETQSLSPLIIGVAIL